MVDVGNLQLHLSKELACRDVFAKKKNCKKQLHDNNHWIMGNPPSRNVWHFSFRYLRFTGCLRPKADGKFPPHRCFFDWDFDGWNTTSIFAHQRTKRNYWGNIHRKTSGDISTYEKCFLSAFLCWLCAVIISWTWPGPVDLEKIPHLFKVFCSISNWTDSSACVVVKQSQCFVVVFTMNHGGYFSWELEMSSTHVALGDAGKVSSCFGEGDVPFHQLY